MNDHGMARAQSEYDAQEAPYDDPCCTDCGRTISHGSLCRACAAERAADRARDE